MNIVLVVVVAAVVLLAGWLILQAGQSRRKEEEARARTEQLQRDLQTLAGQTLNFSQQLGQLSQNVTKSLEGVTGALQKGITDSAQIAAHAQSAMAGELKNSREALGQIQQQLGAVQQAGHEMSQSAQTLQNILGGAKSRGSLGEVALERLLEDALPKERYKRQFRFTTGETADAVIFLRDKVLPIDSKFPLDAFRRMSEQKPAPGVPQTEEARRAFAVAVKGHAETIAKKYILPNEGTLGIAMMFVPSENVYYELLMTADAKGQPLDEYCRSKNVIAVSPNTLYAHLQVILMGLQGMQIEENAKRLQASLAGMQKQMDNFTTMYEKLGMHLKNAQNCFTDSEKRLDKAKDMLAGMLGGERTEPALENVQGTLELAPSPEASAKKTA
ncbi:MAG TPA: DNA recombination protein RmuC [Candidatus Angelobacter sp.]|nr:DNA recombination protein RmuC [Candidatus Angelobacter sp.]